MKKILYLIIVFTILNSCSTKGVNDPNDKPYIEKANTNVKVSALTSDNLKIVSTKSFDNGVAISWLVKGNGEGIGKGDVVLIDYKVTLENGDIVDGNHLLKKESFPFLVGFQMQTKGWDFALKNLKVGDFARVKIPSNLARGENGIRNGNSGWLIPPNADNYLSIHIISKMTPTRVIDGTKVWVFEENRKNKLKFNKKDDIVFHCMISSESNPLYTNSFRSNTPFNLTFKDKGQWPGLKKALINAKKADRMYVVVPSSEAYSTSGFEEFVKPNEDLFYNVLVLDVVKK